MGKKNEDAAVQKNELSLQSEDKFRAIFEGVNDGILVADAKTRKFILANSRICEITGYSQEELLKLSVNDIHLKKDLPRVISEFTKLLQRKIITAKDIPVLRKDKGVVYCDINSKVVKIGGQECLVGFFRDITERRKRDETVKQSEQKLSQIIQGSSVATFVIDKNHKVIYWNSACKNLTGIPAGRMIGKDKQWSAFYKEKRSLLADMIVDGAKESEINKLYEGKSKKSLVLEGAYEAEKFLPKLGKSGRWLLFTAAPLKNSKGQITGAIETLQDVTERKIVEEELKESEERYRILYESSWDAIMTLAPPSWLFTSGNPATVKLFGARNEKEFITKGPWDVSPEYQPDGAPSSDKAKKMIEKAMKEGSNFFEWTHKKLSGEDFPASVLLTRMKIKNQTFLQATVRDVTEQKKAEEELKSKIEELERFNKLSVGRELKMIELKKRIKELEELRKK